MPAHRPCQPACGPAGSAPMTPRLAGTTAAAASPRITSERDGVGLRWAGPGLSPDVVIPSRLRKNASFGGPLTTRAIVSSRDLAQLHDGTAVRSTLENTILA